MQEAMNVRSPEMWRFIFSAIHPINGIKVMDLGAGYGDIALRFAKAGANVIAVEDDPVVVSILLERIKAHNYPGVQVMMADIQSPGFIGFSEPGTDLFVLTSVLPYMNDPDDILDKMSKAAKYSIIECQYSGDGPGFDFIQDDADMRMWLEKYWPWVEKIGETKLDIRPATRSIWLCHKTRGFE